VLLDHCGQGELALLASLVKKNVTFTACEPDPDKLEIATHCASIPSNLHYCASAPMQEWTKVVDLDSYVQI